MHNSEQQQHSSPFLLKPLQALPVVTIMGPSSLTSRSQEPDSAQIAPAVSDLNLNSYALVLELLDSLEFPQAFDN